MNKSSDTQITNFLITKEYKRFVEFCKACQRERYIGLCYGSPGVGKTLSARYYAKWHLLEHRLPVENSYLPLPQEIQECRTLFYTPEVINSPKRIYSDLSTMRAMLSRFVEEVKYKGTVRFYSSDNPHPDYCQLIIIDEADRLKIGSIEQLRDIYDRGNIGLVFIGMPGLEKRMSRYPQLYSRIGFAHEYCALSKAEVHFVLEHHWKKIGCDLKPDDFTDQEAVSAIVRITKGNFRLLQRLFSQVERILKINNLNTVTKEVVEAARECLVIGTT